MKRFSFDLIKHLIVKLQTLESYFEPPADTWDLIHLIAKTPAGIINLMRYYYEPTDEDRLLKRKLPSSFHTNLARSIAMQSGQIIVTTNRDRLIEWGLAKMGITPEIIKDGRDLDNMIPFQNAKCTLIKLNGDYLDLEPPQFDQRFKTLINREIQQAYQPTMEKSSPADQAKFSEFNF